MQCCALLPTRMLADLAAQSSDGRAMRQRSLVKRNVVSQQQWLAKPRATQAAKGLCTTRGHTLNRKLEVSVWVIARHLHQRLAAMHTRTQDGKAVHQQARGPLRREVIQRTF